MSTDTHQRTVLETVAAALARGPGSQRFGRCRRIAAPPTHGSGRVVDYHEAAVLVVPVEVLSRFGVVDQSGQGTLEAGHDGLAFPLQAASGQAPASGAWPPDAAPELLEYARFSASRT
ncbi:hypothetical protein [Streptomyces sp. NPDC004830]